MGCEGETTQKNSAQAENGEACRESRRVNICKTPRGAKTSSLTGVQSHFQKSLKKKGPEIDELNGWELTQPSRRIIRVF